MKKTTKTTKPTEATKPTKATTAKQTTQPINKVVVARCTNPRPRSLPRKYVPLGRSIRQGFIDGISEENSPLLHNAYDSEHGTHDPYFSFGNDTIGRDKFDRAVKFEKMREAAATAAAAAKAAAATAATAATAAAATAAAAVELATTE